ncbi:MAG: hypothetical protein RSE91_03300 [Bacilli bacterium]
MAIKSLGKLQKIAIKQESQIIELKETVARKNIELRCIYDRYDYMEEVIEDKVNKKVATYCEQQNEKMKLLEKSNKRLENENKKLSQRNIRLSEKLKKV